MAKGSEGRRSGRALLERGALGALAPNDRWQALCNVASEEGQPVPRTLRVAVARSASQSDDPSNLRLPAGAWWKRGTSDAWVGEGTAQCNGVLRARFGSQGVSRTLLFDLAPGDYVIPSCEHLTVDCIRYTPGTNANAIALLGLDVPTEVNAEITDGAAADFSPMLLTAPSRWGVTAADQAANVVVPGGAYAFELFSDSPVGDANKFELSPPAATRDFVTPAYQPSGPLPVLGDVVKVQARGAAPVACRLVFWVR